MKTLLRMTLIVSFVAFSNMCFLRMVLASSLITQFQTTEHCNSSEKGSCCCDSTKKQKPQAACSSIEIVTASPDKIVFGAPILIDSPLVSVLPQVIEPTILMGSFDHYHSERLSWHSVVALPSDYSRPPPSLA